MTTARSARRSAPTAPVSSLISDLGDPLRGVWLALVSGLYFIRWWQPTEGTALGNTLPIAEGWFIALALAGWLGMRGTACRVKMDGWQWAVCLLAAGHILSGLIIVGTSGDRRAAVNLIWEWTALAVAFPLLRVTLAKSEARREWTVVALAAVLTLSSYGLTQRYVFYPQMIADYERQRQELDKLEETAAAGGFADVQRMQRIRSQMLGNGLAPHMLSGSGRALLEGRLKHSSEPLGRFALANSFAGLLLIWWSVLALQTVQFAIGNGAKIVPGAPGEVRRAGKVVRLAGLVVTLLVIGYCLLLTKSRTAYVGGAVSLLVWWLGRCWKWTFQRRQLVIGGLLAIVGIGGITLMAGLTGGLDRLVLAEAPKSLQYRLEYWWSSLQVIRESPLVGVGPGQFRQHYLAHKLPRSSEEIADPHNLILDVWANGGLLALTGLGWLVFCIIRGLWLPRRELQLTGTDGANSAQVQNTDVIPLARSVSESGVTPRSSRKIPQPKALLRKAPVEADVTSVVLTGWASPLRWGALTGLLVLWLVEGALEMPLLVFLVAWVIAIQVLDVLLPAEDIRPVMWVAASLGLLTHLCGAGGIGMPAISQLLLVAAIFAGSGTLDATEFTLPKWGIAIALAGGLGLFAGSLWTAAQPVAQVQSLLARADYAKLPSQREQLYRQATLADPLASQPWDRLAETLFAKWRSNSEPDSADLERAILAQQAVVERDPRSFHSHRGLGMFYNAGAEKSGKQEEHRAAVREMQIALSRYPHNSELQADSADVFKAAGEVQLAATAARAAIEQDDINHRAGHTDKWLTDKVRKRMEQMSTK
jgi:hypothetical protein